MNQSIVSNTDKQINVIIMIINNYCWTFNIYCRTANYQIIKIFKIFKIKKFLQPSHKKEIKDWCVIKKNYIFMVFKLLKNNIFLVKKKKNSKKIGFMF